MLLKRLSTLLKTIDLVSGVAIGSQQHNQWKINAD